MTDPGLTETRLRQLLLEADPGEPAVDVDALRRGGRRQRRRRQVASVGGAAALVCAVVVGAGLLLGPGTGTSSPAASTLPTSARSSTAATTARSPVRTVSPGEKVMISSSSDLSMTTTQLCYDFELNHPAAQRPRTCRSVTDGNQAPGTVGLQVEGSVQTGSVYSGIYLGTAAAAIVLTDLDTGATQVATIVRLAGPSTWVAYYATGPFTTRAIGPSSSQYAGAATYLQVAVYDAQGRFLTQLRPPTTAEASASSAKAIVTAFYGAIAVHDAVTAGQLLAPEYLATFASPTAFQSWVENFTSITVVSVGPPRSPSADELAQYPRYTDLLVVPVSYDAVLKQPSGNDASGPADRFLLVGRSSSAGPWLILNEGSSP
jgi:hypothetical protein